MFFRILIFLNAPIIFERIHFQSALTKASFSKTIASMFLFQIKNDESHRVPSAPNTNCNHRNGSSSLLRLSYRQPRCRVRFLRNVVLFAWLCECTGADEVCVRDYWPTRICYEDGDVEWEKKIPRQGNEQLFNFNRLSTLTNQAVMMQNVGFKLFYRLMTIWLKMMLPAQAPNLQWLSISLQCEAPDGRLYCLASPPLISRGWIKQRLLVAVRRCRML